MVLDSLFLISLMDSKIKASGISSLFFLLLKGDEPLKYLSKTSLVQYGSISSFSIFNLVQKFISKSSIIFSIILFSAIIMLCSILVISLVFVEC